MGIGIAEHDGAADICTAEQVSCESRWHTSEAENVGVI